MSPRHIFPFYQIRILIEMDAFLVGGRNTCSVSGTVNVMCQRNWVKGYPDGQCTSFPGVSARLFPAWLASEWVDWGKKTVLTDVVKLHPIHWRLEWNQNGDGATSLCLLELGHPSSPDLGHWSSWFSGLQTILGIHHWVTCSSGLCAWTGTTLRDFLGLPLVDGSSWDFLPP